MQQRKSKKDYGRIHIRRRNYTYFFLLKNSQTIFRIIVLCPAPASLTIIQLDFILIVKFLSEVIYLHLFYLYVFLSSSPVQFIGHPHEVKFSLIFILSNLSVDQLFLIFSSCVSNYQGKSQPRCFLKSVLSI